MSVYTPVTKLELSFFLTDYNLGELVELKGIQAGIENTNYRVKTTQGDFILTLFEFFKVKELPFFINLLNHLQQGKIVCPQPQLNKQGKVIGELNSKPAAIFNCLQGESVSNPTVEQCAAIGSELGKIHQLGINYPEKKANKKGKIWRQKFFLKLQNHLTTADNERINQYFLEEATRELDSLPKGIIHADLFKDNVLCKGNKITGVLDFYLACYDSLLYDLAITVNDWCCYQNHFNAKKVTALLEAYQQYRPLIKVEKQNWKFVLQTAALRFWLSRLENKFFQKKKTATLSINKDPDIFKHIFIQHI